MFNLRGRAPGLCCACDQAEFQPVSPTIERRDGPTGHLDETCRVAETLDTQGSRQRRSEPASRKYPIRAMIDGPSTSIVVRQHLIIEILLLSTIFLGVVYYA